jgi:hypothetical protein
LALRHDGRLGIIQQLRGSLKLNPLVCSFPKDFAQWSVLASHQ